MVGEPEAELAVDKSRLLLVEGKDEVNLFDTMISRWSIEDLQVLGVGGKYSFKARLEAVLANARSRNIQLFAIGILRDADDDPAAAMQSVSGTLRTLGLPGPQSSGEFSEGSPSVGIFILPDGQSPGAVEQLCWQSVNDTPAGQCSNEYLRCLQNSSSLESKNTAKTLVHAYLASREDPAISVGVGAQRGYWSLDHPAFGDVRSFLERLAGI